MSAPASHDEAPGIASALVRRATARVLPAVLAVLVLAMAIVSGTGLVLRLLDAGAQLMTAPAWPAALQALAALAGLAAVVDIVMAWRERAAQPRRELRWIGAIAGLVTIAIAATTRPEPRVLQGLMQQRPVLHTDWWPAVSAGLVAVCAIVLSMRRPSSPRPAPTREALLAAAAAGVAGAVAGAGRLSGVAARRSATVARNGVTALEHRALSTARLSGPAADRRLGVFLLMLPPVVMVVVPLMLLLVEYG